MYPPDKNYLRVIIAFFSNFFYLYPPHPTRIKDWKTPKTVNKIENNCVQISAVSWKGLYGAAGLGVRRQTLTVVMFVWREGGYLELTLNLDHSRTCRLIVFCLLMDWKWWDTMGMCVLGLCCPPRCLMYILGLHWVVAVISCYLWTDMALVL